MKKVYSVQELAKIHSIGKNEEPIDDYDKLINKARLENRPEPPFKVDMKTEKGDFEFLFYKNDGPEFDRGIVWFPDGITSLKTLSLHEDFVRPADALKFILENSETTIIEELSNSLDSLYLRKNNYQGPMKTKIVPFGSTGGHNSGTTRDTSSAIGLLYKSPFLH